MKLPSKIIIQNQNTNSIKITSLIKSCKCVSSYMNLLVILVWKMFLFSTETAKHCSGFPHAFVLPSIIPSLILPVESITFLLKIEFECDCSEFDLLHKKLFSVVLTLKGPIIEVQFAGPLPFLIQLFEI